MQILIAEDDNDTATMYKRFLEGRRHHRVIIASGGEECLTIYHETLQNVASRIPTGLQAQPFDVLILDYKMADMDGLEIAKEVLAVNPHQRIIFASAYVKQTLLDSVKQLNQPVELLQKPFAEEQLIYVVEKKEIYFELQRLVYLQITDLLEVHRKLGLRHRLGEELENAELRHEEIRDLLEALREFESEKSRKESQAN